MRADDTDSFTASERQDPQDRRRGGRRPSGPLLVEEYLPGVEIAVEGLLRGGALETLAVFDKPDPLEGPYFEETIYVTPSRLPARRIRRPSHPRRPPWG